MSLIEEIEKNAVKFNCNKDNFRERFTEVSNKCNNLQKITLDNQKEMIELTLELLKKHKDFFDSLSSVKPLKN